MRVELVTTLRRQATKILADLHISKEPVLITEHGQPSAYLVDVEIMNLCSNAWQFLRGLHAVSKQLKAVKHYRIKKPKRK